MTVSVLVLDDHEVVRDGLRTLIDADPDLVLVAEAGTVSEARLLLTVHQPDVALLDIVLPDGDGVQLCREVDSLSPSTACLLLTSFPDPRARLSAAIAGAAGYLAKGCPSDEIAEAIRDAATGDRVIDLTTLQTSLDEIVEGPSDLRLEQLTGQERRVFELIGQGLSNREIGRQLHLSERTVKNYVSHVLAKLDMSRRTEAAVLAARLSERRALHGARGG